MPAQDQSPNPAQPGSRRSFLGLLGWLSVGVVGLCTGAIGAVFALYPAFAARRSREGFWQELAPLDQIPEGQSKHTINATERTGWAEANTRQAVWVVRQGQQLTVFSATCPHEGCTITEKPAGFICLCHLSQMQIDGKKTVGAICVEHDKQE